jgi:hypothetical protein
MAPAARHRPRTMTTVSTNQVVARIHSSMSRGSRIAANGAISRRQGLVIVGPESGDAWVWSATGSAESGRTGVRSWPGSQHRAVVPPRAPTGTTGLLVEEVREVNGPPPIAVVKTHHPVGRDACIERGPDSVGGSASKQPPHPCQECRDDGCDEYDGKDHD